MRAATRSVLVTIACGTAITFLGVGPAQAAGDPRGQVEQGLDQARSICAASGLNDNPTGAGEEPIFAGQVQAYGQLVRQGLKGAFPSPGVACNPTRGAEGPEE
jgi:hypothetical protein